MLILSLMYETFLITCINVIILINVRKKSLFLMMSYTWLYVHKNIYILVTVCNTFLRRLHLEKEDLWGMHFHENIFIVTKCWPNRLLKTCFRLRPFVYRMCFICDLILFVHIDSVRWLYIFFGIINSFIYLFFLKFVISHIAIKTKERRFKKRGNKVTILKSLI